MVVQHNLEAMNANRMLGITQGTLSSSTEKLSSGYKINRAADDAAGLAISEKMRKQIRGLSQASSNAEDGISSVQTAEGALAEVTDMLQRLNELAVQAANGTNSETDRQFIQDEVDQLVTEIDRVAETTKFNETYLLKGDDTKATAMEHTTKYSVTYTKNVGSNKTSVTYNVQYTNTTNMYIVSASIATSTTSTPLTADVANKGSDITKYLTKADIDTTTGFMVNSVTYSSDYVVFQNASLTSYTNYTLDSNTGILSNKKDTYVLDTDTNEIIRVASGQDLSDYIQNVEVDAATGEVTYAVVNDNYRLLTLADVVYDSTEAVTAGDIDFTQGTAGGDNGNVDYIAAQSQSKLYDASGNLISGIALSKYFDDDGNYIGGLFKDSQATDKVETNADIKDYITKSQREVLGDLTFSLHVGADSDRSNKIYTTIETMSAAGLGLTKLKSSSVGIVDETGDNATDAIDIISEAIQRVSTQRSALGAVQNRLEHTIKNLDNVVENTTAAESQIRDTDMATEMVQYSNANILAQAGQAMLAQANQSNQGVLSLLS